MDVSYSNKQLIAVEFPGTVVNVDKFEQCFGGEKQMFSVFRDPSKRLELKFRPDDPYCKGAHGDRFNTTNIILKVVRRTKKKKNDNVQEKANYGIEMLGVVSSTYKFRAMVDFQLPSVSYDAASKQCRSLLPDLVPTTLHSTSWLDKEVELFLPPLVFSRFDLPQDGYADMEMKNRMEKSKIFAANTIGQNRQRRAGFAVFSTFETTTPCNAPNPKALAQLEKYPLEHDLKKKMENLFQERPIWTRTALIHKLKVEKCRIKHILPCCGYYFSNGPWRALWVRFGYDPRKDPKAKRWQILDLRINASITINEQPNRRRIMYYALPNTSSSCQQRVATINTDDLVASSCTSKNEVSEEDELLQQLAYQYLPGELPTCRQCFFQLCEIHLDSVQELIHQNDGKEEFCHEKDGWCVLGTLDKIRELIINDIIKTSKISKEPMK